MKTTSAEMSVVANTYAQVKANIGPLLLQTLNQYARHHGRDVVAQYARLLQLGEGLPYKQDVGGSSPSPSTLPVQLSWSEQRTHTPQVGGSNPPAGTRPQQHERLRRYTVGYSRNQTYLKEIIVATRKYLSAGKQGQTAAEEVVRLFKYAPVAQLVEHVTLNLGVQGSSPCRRT